MTVRTESFSASLRDVLSEISDLMEECSQIAQHVEHAIGDWLNDGAESDAFPVVELQNIDLLRQIQHDLAALLSSEAMADEITRTGNQVNIASLLGTTKLERVRARLRKLAGNQFVEAAPNDNDGPDNGVVDLF